MSVIPATSHITDALALMSLSLVTGVGFWRSERQWFCGNKGGGNLPPVWDDADPWHFQILNGLMTTLRASVESPQIVAPGVDYRGFLQADRRAHRHVVRNWPRGVLERRDVVAELCEFLSASCLRNS